MQRWFWFIKKWSECLNGSIYYCLQTGNSNIPNMVLTNKTKTWTQLYKLILYKCVCDIILIIFVLKYASFLQILRWKITYNISTWNTQRSLYLFTLFQTFIIYYTFICPFSINLNLLFCGPQNLFFIRSGHFDIWRASLYWTVAV